MSERPEERSRRLARLTRLHQEGQLTDEELLVALAVVVPTGLGPLGGLLTAVAVSAVGLLAVWLATDIVTVCPRCTAMAERPGVADAGVIGASDEDAPDAPPTLARE